jgi:hypothetical protein
MHVDLPVSFAMVLMPNFFGPGFSAWSIFDGGVVVCGPVVSSFSPVFVVLNLWRGDLDAGIVLLEVTDGMGLVFTSTAPHGSNVCIELLHGLLSGTRLAV